MKSAVTFNGNLELGKYRSELERIKLTMAGLFL